MMRGNEVGLIESIRLTSALEAVGMYAFRGMICDVRLFIIAGLFAPLASVEAILEKLRVIRKGCDFNSQFNPWCPRERASGDAMEVVQPRAPPSDANPALH
ncbi:hypothetical protein CYMTET_32307 [Cymbomonas tetramitiformis]|uniref:Uncharacterized protein n=1 Tax=Cymbomonas tetramitiformis TaxID=36881 RepID=A0AAE0FF42_9CHLO|nr:hypothetical protein CYMTET_32307 [Cymbomonas tetramitiformis]